MRDGRNVGDHGDFQIACAQRADGGFSACAGALHENFDAAKAVFFCRFRRRFARLLRRKRGTLSGTFETEAARARPGDRVAAHIGNGNQSIVERGLDVNLTFINFFKLFAPSGCRSFFRSCCQLCCPPAIISSSSQRYDGDLSSFSRFSWNSGLSRAIPFCGGFRDSSRSPSVF